MNKTLLKATLKSNYKLWIIFIAILSMYLIITASMFDPENTQALQNMMESMPQAIANMFGMNKSSTTLLGMLATYFYTTIIFAFPMIYCINLGNRLVAKKADKGSIVHFLTMPAKRKNIAITLAVYYILSVVALVSALTLIGLLGCLAFHGNELEIGRYLFLNLIVLLLILCESSICFFFSCLFSESSKAVGVSSGVLIGFLLLNMIAGVSDKFEFLKYISIFGIFDAVKIIEGSISTLVISIVYLLISAGLYIGGIIIFDKKNFYV